MKETGISLGLFMVLSVLHATTAPVTQQAIADRLGLTKGTVSKLLESARQSGYAETSPSPTSRRERAVTLTDAGRAVVDAGDAALAASELARHANEHPRQTAATIQSLMRFVETLESPAASASEPVSIQE
jgi:DNA-binding MarR family transcriptional regulator